MSRSYGPGGFGDQYDNSRMRSMDRDQHPGGVTGIHLDEDFDLSDMDFYPRKGEAYIDQRNEPPRDDDLRYPNRFTPNASGQGPRDWKLSDDKLRERVCEVLTHSHEIDPSEMEVEVEDRGVTLKGSVLTRGMKKIAVDLVESIPGVEDVFTQLTIKNKRNYQLSAKALGEARQTEQS